jgi:hypothetical protein
VLLNGWPARPADQVRASDVLEYEPPGPTEAEPGPEAILLAVVYEDGELVVASLYIFGSGREGAHQVRRH